MKIGIEAITATANKRRSAKANVKLYEDAINESLDVAEIALRERLGETMRTWKTKAAVVVERRILGGFTVLRGDVLSRIWHILDEGAKAHVIVPRKAKKLRFLSGYKPKTRVGRLLAVNGGAFGAPIFARKVYHPGIKARKWRERIEQETSEVLVTQLNKRLSKAAEKGL